jgi:hypothetical protein
LDDDDQEAHQQRALHWRVTKAQSQQGRDVTDEVHAHHQPPLNTRGSFEELLRVAGQRRPHGKNDERVDGNEDAEQAVPPDPHQVVLHRRDDEERPEERAVIAEARRRERHEFA